MFDRDGIKFAKIKHFLIFAVDKSMSQTPCNIPEEKRPCSPSARTEEQIHAGTNSGKRQ